METIQDYYLQTLVVKCMKLKLKMSMKILATIKKCLILVIIQLNQKYYTNSNKLVICKMKYETAGAAIIGFVGMKPKMYPFLAEDNSEHKKAKGVNRNGVATISHNEYKDVLLNNKCIRHSMNRIQSKNHRIGTYEINKLSLFCFDDKLYMQNNGYGRLALCYYNKL